jgi:uncharacterized protein (DUF1330 family)
LAAYLIYICKRIRRRADLENYWAKVGATIPRHLLNTLTAYGRFEVLEGDDEVKGVAIVEFPTMEAAKSWYDSPDYTEVRKHRIDGADYLGILVEGGVVPAAQRMLDAGE